MITRRYHGLMLIAALPGPFGRMVMLSHIAEQVRCPDGRCIEVGGRERMASAPRMRTAPAISIEFRLESRPPGLARTTSKA